MFTIPTNAINTNPDYLVGVEKGQPVLIPVGADSTGGQSRDQSKVISARQDPVTGQILLDDASAVVLSASGVSAGVQGGSGARRRVAAEFSKGALIQAPLWSTGATVTSGQVYRLANGELIYCQTGGTTGASEPTYSTTGAMTDNTVTWLAMGRRTKPNNDGYAVPTITVGTSITGLSERLLSSLANNVTQVSCPNVKAAGGSTTQAWAFNDGSATDAYGLGAGNRGYLRVVEFVTDAPKVAIGRWNIATGKYPVYVDGYLIEENPTPYAAGNPSYYTIDWSGVRRQRTYRIEMPGPDNLRSIAVDTASTICPAPIVGDVAVWLSDSFGGTISTYAQNAQEMLAELVAKSLGVRYLQNLHIGGTGYVATGSGYYTAANLLLNNPSLASSSVSKVIFAHGYNDAGQPTETIKSAAIQAWVTARRMFPKAVIAVVGPWSGASGPDANRIATDAAVQAAFATWQDPRSFFVSQMTDPSGYWVSGTGKWGATTGTGNSDIYTGADGVHPTYLGKAYLLQRLTQSLDYGFSLFGA